MRYDSLRPKNMGIYGVIFIKKPPDIFSLNNLVTVFLSGASPFFGGFSLK